MHSTSEPAELGAAPGESPRDPYSGTPLGVEAAWCPNGIDVPRAAAASEASMRPMDPAC
jgi:hypothetical protein